MVTGSSYSVSNIGDESFAIHHEISMLQNGSVQNAVRYLFDKSLVIGSPVAHSSGVMQSSITLGFFLSKHQESHRIHSMNNGMKKGQIFFMFNNIYINIMLYNNFVRFIKFNNKKNASMCFILALNHRVKQD